VGRRKSALRAVRCLLPVGYWLLSIGYWLLSIAAVLAAGLPELVLALARAAVLALVFIAVVLARTVPCRSPSFDTYPVITGCSPLLQKAPERPVTQ
jgi:hypothetical protein